jgi:hypothetical protein
METKYNDNDFLDWYFGGSDQEQERTLISLGEWVKDMLNESKKCIIDIQELKDSCNMDMFHEDMEYLKTQ